MLYSGGLQPYNPAPRALTTPMYIPNQDIPTHAPLSHRNIVISSPTPCFCLYFLTGVLARVSCHVVLSSPITVRPSCLQPTLDSTAQHSAAQRSPTHPSMPRPQPRTRQLNRLPKTEVETSTRCRKAACTSLYIAHAHGLCDQPTNQPRRLVSLPLPR